MWAGAWLTDEAIMVMVMGSAGCTWKSNITHCRQLPTALTAFAKRICQLLSLTTVSELVLTPLYLLLNILWTRNHGQGNNDITICSSLHIQWTITCHTVHTTLKDFCLVGDYTEPGQGHFLSAGAQRALADRVLHVHMSSPPSTDTLARVVNLSQLTACRSLLCS